MKESATSVRKALLTWSALALGITSLFVGYFLYEVLEKQFEQSWQSRIQLEMVGLQQQLQHNLSAGDALAADKSLAFMAVHEDVITARLVQEDRILFSIRRAEIDLPVGDHEDDFPNANNALLANSIDGLKIFRFGDIFKASIPVRYYRTGLREQQQAELWVSYDTHPHRHALWQELSGKLAILLSLILLYTLGLSQLVRTRVLMPLTHLQKLTQKLQIGKLGETIRTSSTREFIELESSFNQLSLHLEESERRLRRQHALDRAFSRSFPDVALLIDQQGKLIERLGNHQGPVPELNQVLYGSDMTHWLNKTEANKVRNDFQRAMESGKLSIATLDTKESVLESRMLKLELAGLSRHQQAERYVLWLLRDITESRRQQQKIYQQAHFDGLTGLANRRFALEYLSQSMSSHQRDQQFGAVLFVDLDHFKSINDSMGHHVGDEVLTQLATRLRYSVSDQAFCARLGGDEFLVILENLNKNQRDTIVQASLIANKILQVFNQPVPCQNYQYHLSASIGISIFPQPELAPGDAVRQADTAMYYAKSSGRNRFRLYSSDMQTISHQRLALVNDLHLALKEEAFEIYFQPQVNQRGELVAAEALCRWNHRGKILEPSSFISMAEESNLIVPLGQWIIQKSLDVLQSWKSSGCLPNTFQRLALNVSPQQFLDPHFAANLIEALANRNLNAGDIELEITESVLLENTQAVLDSILELSEIGFSIALDDFGKGYSSLSYLKSLPVNTLKIDRAFVAEIDQPGNLNLLVDYVIQLGHSLGIKILAEGVESDRQKSYLAERDCHLYQGFLFSQPMSESDFLKHLERSNH